ncbi:hypothetical protein [Rhodovulum imhoffii]|uniref:hypothetical protein n=1 Tax=Rhodovulum imhoffii TaxID=365340 RepID=UPI0011B2863B|nr:hypothetical protein [Rhodovulum imhoffii]
MSAVVGRVPVTGSRIYPNHGAFPRQRDMADFYGGVGGPQCTAGKVDLAYPYHRMFGWDGYVRCICLFNINHVDNK